MSSEMVPGMVSVIVASYNHAGYLRRRMDSLIAQSYENIEIIVIDDCSPDNSVEILREYADHPKVKLTIREQNGGWVTVSNQGVSLARGEFIIFANCDDDCEPRMIERLVDALQKHPSAGVAFCRSLMVDAESRVMGDDFTVRAPDFRARCAGDTLISREEMRRFLMHSCVIPNLSAALMRRDCFERAGTLSHDYRACSDWDLFFRQVDYCDFAYVAEPLNHFRQHKATIRSATKGRITYDEFFRVLLGQIHFRDFSFQERVRFRLHVMYLWAVELMRPATSGLVNFPHHLALVARLDWVSLLFLPLAILKRILELPFKVLSRLQAKAS